LCIVNTMSPALLASAFLNLEMCFSSSANRSYLPYYPYLLLTDNAVPRKTSFLLRISSFLYSKSCMDATWPHVLQQLLAFTPP
jgi:hypothetical protein